MTINLVLTISFFLLTSLGTFLHFTHRWLKKGLLIHIFSAVNESTWEHMKLLVFPTLLIIVFQYLILEEAPSNLFFSLLVLYLVEIFSIPLIYEPLRIVFKNIDFSFTIIIFILAIIFGVYSQYIVLTRGVSMIRESISILLILFVTILFGLFTYFPPRFFLFKDPTTGEYGDTGQNS